ncbi:O-acetyl-ADP-ribose deacetylase [Kribbella sp. NBC_01245]|uniref:O-acetyl-ADP-ribose deacetylase n=1 Tax=Kribbella sp. NBC_01245 TaxID=2903578 RepID=UPI002E2BB8F1|nr:O-acetyl-ADP-ribose deacetylase [Kribbella sp. NBC_01245]
MRIEVREVDITTVVVDGVVNAAHHSLRGGGGVDGAIHRVGGPAILAECVERYPDGIKPGEAAWTTAGELPASYVIHVVGPNYNAGQRDPETLASCYRNALRIADELGLKTLALPAVSAGIYGWPAQSAADIAVQTISTTPTAVEKAIFCLIEPRLVKAFSRSMKSMKGGPPPGNHPS